MQRGIHSRVRLLSIVVAALVALVALPSIASATVVTSGSGSQTQRESWARYIYRFGGSITATGTASYATGSTTRWDDDVVSFPFTRTGTTYDITSRGTAGRGVIALAGGVTYAVPAHYISVSVSDPQITLASTTDSAAVVSAVVSYDPYETTGAQIVNPTTPTRIDVYTLDLTGTFTQVSTSSHRWANAVARLTAGGANAFNGGINGSYAAGDLFGTFSFAAAF